jgi:hypothetical protein
VELLASKLNLTVGTVSFHLKKLEKAGLVNCSRTQFYMIYSLNRNELSRTIESFFTLSEKLDDDTIYKNKVIDSFFEDGRLKSIPAQLKNREIVYQHILGNFELNHDYTEAEVNEIVKKYHEDFCTIRREFICLGYMERNHEIYRRLK